MVSAIILAGGKGKRMNSNVSKQFIKVNNKPIIYYTLKKFLECSQIDNIVLQSVKDTMNAVKPPVDEIKGQNFILALIIYF